MSYFSNIENGSVRDGLGCGPACNCGPCKSGLNGLEEWYEREKAEDDETPLPPVANPPQPPEISPPTSERTRRVKRRTRASAGLGHFGFRAGGFSGPPMLAPRCYALDLTVPQTYDALEEIVRRWISTCVSSRTEVRPGVPIHRERELVNGNPSLRGIWDRVLQYLKGKRIRVAAQYIWGANREEAITFSTSAIPPSPQPIPAPAPAQARTPCPPLTCTPVGTLLPSKHGLKFSNSFSLTIPLPPPYPAITGTYGLCGGMASAVLDYYLSCIPIPSAARVPGPGDPLYSYIFKRLLHSLGAPNFGMVAKFLSWSARQDVTTSLPLAAAQALGPGVVPALAVGLGPFAMNAASRVTVDGVQELTLPEFRGTVASITSGRMVVLGLVYQGPFAVDIWKNHQVLAIGINSGSGPTTDIQIYDPNYPGRDDVVIRCEVLPGGSRVRCVQLLGNSPMKDTVRGFFRMPYTRHIPPCLP